MKRTMKAYPVEDGTIELLFHREGKTYGLKISTADFNSREEILAQLHKMCSISIEGIK